HYLDNSATTQVWPEVADLVREVLVERYGNPSSLHSKGLEAELLMKSAAADLARILNCAPEELYFTSGGTEANNRAILSGYESRRRRATGVVTTAFEHSSVLEPVQYLAERQGAQAVFVAPDGEGHIRRADVLERVDENTALVSLM
ncbi:aminotransferase class V-fold PLP-dependent enzyme, partial [Bittarella massiliensis (ex Durand et al. 2017)]